MVNDMKNNKPIKCVACSIFKAALNNIEKKKQYNMEIQYLNSMLHMHPKKFSEEVFPEIYKAEKEDLEVLIAYGDCHPCMQSITSHENIERLDGVNCIELFLGKKLYKKYQKEKTFFLLPEWIIRWKEVFEKELGFFDKKFAKEFMGEFFTKILFIDVENVQIKNEDEYIKSIGEYTGLKVDRIYITTEILEEAIEESLEILHGGRQDVCK